MNSKASIFALVSAVTMVSQLTIGTSPTPPPYHQYWVSGRIVRNSSLPLNDFVVSLEGKFPNSLPDSLVSIT